MTKLEEILEEIRPCLFYSFDTTKEEEISRAEENIKDLINQAFQAGKDSIKEEILNKLPKRKSENKKKKDQEEWINIPRIQRAVGFNSCLNQVKNIIKNV